MEKTTKALLLNVGALICGVWFFFAGMVWMYWAALFFAYPIGLLGIVLWWLGKRQKMQTTFNRIVLGVFILGLVCSVGMLVYLLIYD